MENLTASGPLLLNLLIYWPKFGILFGISKFWCLSMFLIISGRLNRFKNIFSSLRNLPGMILDKIRKHHFFHHFLSNCLSKSRSMSQLFVMFISELNIFLTQNYSKCLNFLAFWLAPLWPRLTLIEHRKHALRVI